jgi:hemerythrin
MSMERQNTAWMEFVEVGLPIIDRQHRLLFDLAASFRGQGDQIRVIKTLVALCDYANTHLRDEEAMLRLIDYPAFAEHKRQHAHFRRMLRELLEDSRKITLDQIAERVEVLINGWFYQHIMKDDADYMPAVNASAIDLAAGH